MLRCKAQRFLTPFLVQRIDYVEMRTDQPLDVAISSYLSSRMMRTK